MIGRIRNTAQRTLILTGLLLAAVSITSAGDLKVLGAKAVGSTVYVAVANPSSQPESGTVAVVVQVNGSEVVRTAAVVLASGQSTVVAMNADAKIEGISSVGIADEGVPF